MPGQRLGVDLGVDAWYSVAMNILFKTVFGSHLYGCQTETSDKDYKGVYLDTLKNVVLNRSKATVLQRTNSSSSGRRNDQSDVDVEYKELRKFIWEAMSGQTYAIELLFSPKSHWEVVSPVWEEIVQHRDKLLSKKLTPFISYCRTQCGKYGLKGSRLGELKRVVTLMGGYGKSALVSDALPAILPSNVPTEFVKVVQVGEEQFLEVIGKRFILKQKIEKVLESLSLSLDKYGQRSAQAEQNQAVDWKACHHALRVCLELEELLDTGEIKFPLREHSLLMEIKLGRMDYKVFDQLIVEKMKVVEQKMSASTMLRNEPDSLFWEDFLMNAYQRQG